MASAWNILASFEATKLKPADMPWRPPSGLQADVLWSTFKQPLLMNVHGVLAALSFCAALKAGQQAPIPILAGVAHLVAFFCCRAKVDPADFQLNKRLCVVANLCGIASGWLRTIAHLRWIFGLPLTPALAHGFTSGWVYVADAFMSSLEQCHAMMLLPGAVVAIWLAMHLRAVYSVLAMVNAQPGVPTTVTWALTNLVLPHLLHLYMYKTLQLGRGVRNATTAAVPTQPPSQPKVGLEVGPKEGGVAASSSQEGPAKESPTAQKAKAKAHTAAAAASQNGVKRQTSNGSIGGAGAVQDLDSSVQQPQGSLSRKGTAGAAALEPAVAGPAEALMAPLRAASGAIKARHPAPSEKVLQALRNARALQQRGARPPAYCSRLVQPQAVVIKLESSEPEQLRQDMIAAVNRTLNQGRAQLVVGQACVRKGCALLVFDLLPTSTGEGMHSVPVKAWLDSLLSPGTSIPDGAVAHISLGGRQLKATWWEDGSTWIVEELDSRQAAAAGGVPVDLSVLFVDRPVARLLPPASKQSAAGTSAAGNTGSIHRANLLLKMPQQTRSLAFCGSDQVSAPPDQPSSSDGGPVSVQCVARGCWGTCLPVAVAGWEMQEADQEAGEDQCSLVAVTLDVDLSQAPSAGSVQLELWCGRALQASAPLLLLPSLIASSSHSTDPLLQELEQCIGRLGWGEGAQSDGAKPSSGAAALLADLGQVLYSAECVQRAADGAGPAQAGSSSSGPNNSWGGIVAGLATQHASDPDTLSGVLSICEGLLEYAQEQGHTHTADLLSQCAARLQQRLQQVQGAGSSAAAARPAEAAIPAATAGPYSSLDGASTLTVASSTDGDAWVIGKVVDTQGKASPAHQPEPVASPPEKGTVASGKLKQRRQPSASKLASKLSAGAHNTTQSGPAAGASSTQQAAAAGQRATWASFLQCAKCTVLGFESADVERQYKQWTAVRSRALTITHSLLIMVWVMTSTARSISDGWESFGLHLPVHLLCILPYIASALIAIYRQHRWHQVSLVGHAVGRTLANTGVALGVLAMPATYSAMCKIKLGLWGEVLLHPLSEALCFPALLCAHTVLAVFDIALLHICGLTAPVFLAQALGLRACALAVGLGTDMGRRFAFIQQKQKQALASKSGKSC